MKFTLIFFAFSCLLLKGTLLDANSIDTKSTSSPTVAYFNAWTIGWNADRLKHGLSGYWDSPIFHPVDHSFAFSEPQPATLIVAPLVWISDSPLLAYKVWLLICLVGNGLAAVLVCRRLEYQRATQWVAGFGMILLPVCQQRIDVVQLVPVWGMLWFFSSLYLLSQNPSRPRGVECGVAFATCFALCLHHSLFLCLVMVFSCVAFLPKPKSSSFYTSSLLALVVAGICICPLVLPILQAFSEHEFVRSEKLVDRLSAKPEQYLASQDNAWLDPLNWMGNLKPGASSSRRFHIGWIRMLFAAAAVAIALRSKRHRRWTLFLVLMGTAGFAFSMGPHLNIGGWKPWETVQQYVPGFKQVRNVFRFAWFVQMSVMLLAFGGFDALVGRLGRLRPDHSGRDTNVFWRKGMLLACGLILAAEVWPEPATAHYVPPAEKHRKWVSFVREECPPGRPIVCLPMSLGDKLRDMEIESRWMLLGLGHSVPMLNGYSGFFPDSYRQVTHVLNKFGASDELFAELMQRQVGLIVVARGFPITKAIAEFQSDNFVVQHLFADEIGVDIYSFRMQQ